MYVNLKKSSGQFIPTRSKIEKGAGDWNRQDEKFKVRDEKCKNTPSLDSFAPQEFNMHCSESQINAFGEDPPKGGQLWKKVK